MEKRKIIMIVAIVVGTLAVGISIFAIVHKILKDKNTIEELNASISDYQLQLDAFGELIEVYTVNREISSGEIFDSSSIESLLVPSAAISDNYIMNLAELENYIYKVDCTPGTPLVWDLFTSEVITPTERFVDIVVDVFPVEPRVGQYYDIRLVTPNGLDYIVLSKKRVYNYYGTAVKMKLNEEEIHQYQSAMVDTFLNTGTYLYVDVYVEPAMQKKATVFYPVSELVISAMEADPNIIAIAEQDMLMKRRQMFEAGLEIDKDTKEAITSGRSDQVSRLQKAKPPVTEEEITNVQEEGGGLMSKNAQQGEQQGNGENNSDTGYVPPGNSNLLQKQKEGGSD